MIKHLAVIILLLLSSISQAGQSTLTNQNLPVALGRFDGTNTGTFTVDHGFGITGVTRLSAGYYQVHLSQTMANTNYVILVSSESTPTNDTNINVMIENASITANSFAIKTGSTHGIQNDVPSVHFVVYGNIAQ